MSWPGNLRLIVTPDMVRGVNTGMKSGGHVSFLGSALSWPGNLRLVVTPDMVRGVNTGMKSGGTCQLPEVSIELAGEPEAGCHP